MCGRSGYILMRNRWPRVTGSWWISSRVHIAGRASNGREPNIGLPICEMLVRFMKIRTC